jgi:hypothetical protein
LAITAVEVDFRDDVISGEADKVAIFSIINVG